MPFTILLAVHEKDSDAQPCSLIFETSDLRTEAQSIDFALRTGDQLISNFEAFTNSEATQELVEACFSLAEALAKFGPAVAPLTGCAA
jgi:hypothetical protein